MDIERIVPILDEMWNHLEFLFSTGGGDQDHWRKEPYRSDFFDAFRDAFAVEPLHGDTVFDIVSERHLKRNDEQYEEKCRELWSICSAWSEWLYAWQHYPATEP